MKKLISACLITSMLAAPCTGLASADGFASTAGNAVSWTGKKLVEVPLKTGEFVIDEFLKYPKASIAAFIVGGYAARSIAKKIDSALSVEKREANGGYTHQEKENGNKYVLPQVTYNNDIYELKPQFTACPSSDNDCNVYYSSTGKFSLKLNDAQKKHFSDRGYISVKLREVPQKEIGTFKKPLVWAYSKLTGKKPSHYNEFYLHGPDLAQPTFGGCVKDLLTFKPISEIPFLEWLVSKLPWVEKDFIKLNYGIVLTNKDEEGVLNFKAPTTSDYTKEYKAQIDLDKKRKEAHPDEEENFGSVEAIYNNKKQPLQYIKRKVLKQPDNKYYTEDDIKKSKADNAKKKETVLNKLANACQDNYLTSGEIARLSLQNPEQTFRLVINNATGTWDADKLSALLSRTNERIPLNDPHPSLLFDFEYVLPLPERLQNASAAKQPNAAKVLAESKSIENANKISTLSKLKNALSPLFRKIASILDNNNNGDNINENNNVNNNNNSGDNINQNETKNDNHDLVATVGDVAVGNGNSIDNNNENNNVNNNNNSGDNINQNENENDNQGVPHVNVNINVKAQDSEGDH